MQHARPDRQSFIVRFVFAFFALGAAGCEPSFARDAPESGRVIPGITVLLSDSLHIIAGRRVGLITNHTARDADGASSIDLLSETRGVRLTALFAPEHGIRGAEEGGARIAAGIDAKTGVPIFSLYGDTKVPTPRMLQNVDVLVYDIQDVGARMYTYVWTMTLAAEAAKKAGKIFVVADRPNPIRADIAEGGLIEKAYRSFTGLHNVPLRYGLTVGELALYLMATGQIDAGVVVAPMKNYRQSTWWEDTGLAWIKPSPNIRSVDAAVLYPGMSFFEATNVSEGRGTDFPFRVVGARWLTDAAAIATVMNAKHLPGVKFDVTTQKIGGGEKFGSETIPMVRLTITDRNTIRSSVIAVHLLREIFARHPKQFKWQAGQGIEELSGSKQLRAAVQNGRTDALLSGWAQESRSFLRSASNFRLYR
ncbi:MAG: DUF1343 domain-containing protein [Gemmatimonadaceae bacterium]